MIKKTFIFLLCFYVYNSLADTPGKKPMSESKITIHNLDKLTDYDFYWLPEYDSVRSIKGNPTMIIPSSGGAPYNATFWGVNRITKVPTDTLSFENYYAPDCVITIDSIANNKLRYTKKEISNSNAGGVLGDNDTGSGNRTTKIIMFSAISLIALILLVWFFMRRKNKSQEA